MGVEDACSWRGVARRSLVQGSVVGIVVVVVVGRLGQAGALEAAVELRCRSLVGGKVRRSVFELDIVGLVAGGSRSLDGIYLGRRCWCWRGLCRVAWSEEVVLSMCLLAEGTKAL